MRLQLTSVTSSVPVTAGSSPEHFRQPAHRRCRVRQNFCSPIRACQADGELDGLGVTSKALACVLECQNVLPNGSVHDRGIVTLCGPAKSQRVPIVGNRGSANCERRLQLSRRVLQGEALLLHRLKDDLTIISKAVGHEFQRMATKTDIR